MFLRSRKKFPTADLRPVGGELTGAIAYNSMTNKELALEYQIVVNLAPFSLANVKQDTAIKIFSLPLNIHSWRNFAGHEYRFSAEPEQTIMVDGERVPFEHRVSGSIRLLDEYLPVDVTRITFGKQERGEILTTLDMIFDLEKIEYPKTQITMDTSLTIKEIRIRGDIAMIATPPPDEAEELAAQFLNLDDYEPQLMDNGVVYCPKLVHG